MNIKQSNLSLNIYLNEHTDNLNMTIKSGVLNVETNSECERVNIKGKSTIRIHVNPNLIVDKTKINFENIRYGSMNFSLVGLKADELSFKVMQNNLVFRLENCKINSIRNENTKRNFSIQLHDTKIKYGEFLTSSKQHELILVDTTADHIVTNPEFLTLCRSDIGLLENVNDQCKVSE